MKHLIISFFLTAMFALGFVTPPAAAEEPEAGNFQIMKATADKVWRLNKNTGEISVCSLDGERMVCTSSSEAMRPPAVTYEERQAEKKSAADAEKEKNLAFLDRALSAIRSLFEAAMERESGEAQ